jgi:hypothetical protein
MVGAQIAAMMLLAQAAVAPAAAPDSTVQRAAATSDKTVSEVTVEAQKSISKRREVDPNQVSCHDELPPGTRFKIKVCATNRQFAERTRDQQQMVREWLNTPKTVRQ